MISKKKKNSNKDPRTVTGVDALIPPVPGLAMGMMKEISKLACAYSKTKIGLDLYCWNSTKN